MPAADYIIVNISTIHVLLFKYYSMQELQFA